MIVTKNTFRTEWGFAPDTYTSLYAQCLKGFLENYGVGWTMWDVCGSYYIRDGVLNFDETWGEYLVREGNAGKFLETDQCRPLDRSFECELDGLEERKRDPKLLHPARAGHPRRALKVFKPMKFKNS